MRARVAIATPLILVLLVAAGPMSAGANTVSNAQLIEGSAQDAGFIPKYLDQIRPDVNEGLATQSYGHPAYAGAAVVAARHGVIAESFSTGFALRYANASSELPRDKWLPVRERTMFDLASLTKAFTATAATQLMASGRLRLEAPVARYLPEFAQAGKGSITIRMLLTHTSGLPADPVPALWSPVYTSNEQRWAAVMATVPIAAPGAQYLYSDVNYLTLQRVIEGVTGYGLSRVIREGITGPLGMRNTMFNPPRSLRYRIAATEYQVPPLEPARGMVWGSVDDENAWALGGVAGHAGLFSTTHDLAIFSQMILNRGSYGGVRVVPRAWADGFFRDYNRAYPGEGHSLIMQINQYPDYFGAMDTLHTIGHTGFTGTSIVINPVDDTFVILLTNRVHPTRTWTGSYGNNPQRRAVADDVARAVAVRPLEGKYSWFSGMPTSPLDMAVRTQASTLTVPVELGSNDRSAQLHFNLWYRLIPSQAGPQAQLGTLQTSVDQGQSWQPLPFALRQGNSVVRHAVGTFTGLNQPGWSNAIASLPVPPEGSSKLLVRVQVANQALWQGRGVYVNHITVRSAGNVVFDDARARDADSVVVSGGFQRSAD
ncbi:MAG: serine hydrolase [Actinomycetota bacterium]|nr:serine hydrolase [Actinomycetota bacterium]